MTPTNNDGEDEVEKLMKRAHGQWSKDGDLLTCYTDEQVILMFQTKTKSLREQNESLRQDALAKDNQITADKKLVEMLEKDKVKMQEFIDLQTQSRNDLAKEVNTLTTQITELREAINPKIESETMNIIKVKCEWSLVSETDNIWRTGCGRPLRFTSTNFKYCPYCSNEVKFDDSQKHKRVSLTKLCPNCEISQSGLEMIRKICKSNKHKDPINDILCEVNRVARLQEEALNQKGE